jgi:hypothetical protein
VCAVRCYFGKAEGNCENAAFVIFRCVCGLNRIVFYFWYVACTEDNQTGRLQTE